MDHAFIQSEQSKGSMFQPSGLNATHCSVALTCGLDKVKKPLTSDKEPGLTLYVQKSETELAKDRQKWVDQDTGASSQYEIGAKALDSCGRQHSL